MSSFLVTGGAGFIGSHLTERLLHTGHRVVVVDNFNDFYDPRIKESNIAAIRALGGDCNLYREDICTLSTGHALFREKFDAIIHIAAMAGVRPSIHRPVLYQQVNVLGTQNLLEIAREHDIPKFVFASSSSVYGTNPNVPWKETENLFPISPYAATKLGGEMAGRVAHHLYNMDFIALRFFTVYGPRQRPDLAISKFIRAALEENPIELYGDGSSSRDYTYIEDIVDGVVAALSPSLAGYRIINLGNNNPVPLRDLVSAIERVTGKTLRIIHKPPKPGDVERTCACVEKAAAELGYAPRTDLMTGLRFQYAWEAGGRMVTR